MGSKTSSPPRPEVSADGSSDTGTIQDVKEQAQSALQQAQNSAAQAAKQARQQATSALESQKGKATESLSAMSQALRQSGHELRHNDMGPVAQVPVKAADQVDKLSSYLSSKSVAEIIADAEQFARENPATYLAAAVALGVLAARFLKTTSPAGGSSGTGA